MVPAGSPSIDWSYIAYYALGPLLTAAAIVASARLRLRGALLIVSALALGVVFLGVALYDYATGFGMVSFTRLDDAQAQALNLSELLRPVGFMLGFAAIALALALAVRARRWAWVTALSVTGLVLSWSHRAFYGLPFLSWLGGSRGFFTGDANNSPFLFRNGPPDFSQMHTYFALFSLLLVASAIPSVVFALRAARNAQDNAASGAYIAQ